MRRAYAQRFFATLVSTAVAVGFQPPPAHAACCYFSAKDKDIQQPGQKVFITWDRKTRIESFTVQPKFEGNALDFGMVIPTPSKPKLDEMPRDFFKELAVFTLLKNREFPESKLLPLGGFGFAGGLGALGFAGGGLGGFGGGMPFPQALPRKPAVRVLETGLVGSLDYKIITADRAGDLHSWLRDNKYNYSGDEATLDFYVNKKWFFTVMKIDTMQMKKNKDGGYTGEVTPTRFQFGSDQLIYPLKITQISVKDKTEALFYVQAAYKVDLPEDLTYQYQWLPMLENAQGWYQKGAHQLPGKADDWLKATKDQRFKFLQRGQELGFAFTSGQRPEPNKEGRIATTLEWAKRLTVQDTKVLSGMARYSDRVPDVDAGYTAEDFADRRKAAHASQVIKRRLNALNRTRPAGFLVREAPAEDIKQLKILLGHLKEGQFLTKLRKTFVKGEMEDDLLIVPAKLGDAEDRSEYEEILPTSPP